jgi:hypothetical protein
MAINLLPFLLDIVKFTMAGMGVVWIAFYMAKPYLERDDKIQLLEFRKSLNNQTMPLRLQAYERLVLFIERLNPSNSLIRLNATSYSAQELYALLLEDVRAEYQHNVTQQIYVSSRAWAVIKHIKDDTLGIVTKALKSLPENATGLDLSKTILGSLSQLEDNPYDVGCAMMRKDLEELF